MTDTKHTQTLDTKESVERLLGYQLRTGYDIQSGDCTESPAVVFADADYEVGDGSCGLYGDQKTANEPAIPYVRIDSLLSIAAERDALKAEVDELEASSRIWEALHETLNDKLAALEAQPVKVNKEKLTDILKNYRALDELLCCSGFDSYGQVGCGCRGVTLRDEIVDQILYTLDTTHSQTIRDAALEEASGLISDHDDTPDADQSNGSEWASGWYGGWYDAQKFFADAIRQLKDTDQ